MGRSRISMLPLAWTLKRAGYRVLNWGYSSTRFTVAELGTQLQEALRERFADVSRIHFVGHSLGTVLARWVLAHDSLDQRAGRVVMIAPPNRGSRKADRSLRRWGWLLKPIADLTTAPASPARTLRVPANVEVGVIAGEFDGKVSVEETHLAGETDHVVVPAVHSFLMLRRDVRTLTLRFLHTGSFSEAD
jgi:pimeloyl-ACP methyl ester carboxylesterase